MVRKPKTSDNAATAPVRIRSSGPSRRKTERTSSIAETIVVVPTLITSPPHARQMAERLEVHALANPDPSLRFALLTDWPDADAATAPGDEGTLRAGVLAIRDLKEGTGLEHMPSGNYHANGAWLAAAVLAHNLNRWTTALADQPPATNRTMRTSLIALAAVTRIDPVDQRCACPPDSCPGR